MLELQAELQTYRSRLPYIVGQHEGEYVVIKECHPLHFSPTYSAALEWAYEAYGFGNFLVKKVSEHEQVAHFTRDLGPCRL